MGNCVSVSIPCDSCMNKGSQWLEGKGSYIHNLEKNLTSLETTMEELKAKRDDLSRKVTREEDRGQQRLAEIQVWLTRTETVENRVSDLLSDGDVEIQRLCLCGFCSKSLISSYRYGKRVFLALREVERLKSKVFEAVAEQAQTPQVQERPLQPTIVGQETMLDKAWNHLMEDGVGIMGLYGMGGVGKTTLLKQINNKLSQNRCEFDFVIWVVVSKELHIEKIQDEIAQKVGLGEEKCEKADLIYNFLRKKRFVLFLDDIWEKVDLDKIGVPFPTRQNRCKLVFTTRSLDVCTSMEVQDPMEVQCLAENDAFGLFQKKVGQVTLGSDPEIPSLARIVARKCRGLPLALNVIGKTMSCKRMVQEWHHAIDVLSSYAIEFSGMEDEILSILKYSYDNLKEEHVKSCLLYCALFPEDYRISKRVLIDHMICEGIIDGSEDIERAENKGYDIIGSLVRASLLMEELKLHSKEEYVVCMHDVVREMALWIASDLGKQKEAFITRGSVGLCTMPKVENWKVVRKMSLMDNEIHHLDGSPECLELTTLLIQNAKLANISSEFFKSMPKLAVLDLSENLSLFELPDSISELGSLQYLNLSGTGLRHLPKGLEELKKLINLDLERTSNLSSIVGISRLHNLKVLNLVFCGFTWDLNIVEELETLEHLEILKEVRFRNHSLPLEKFLSSHKLMSCTRILSISNSINHESSGISLPITMNKLCEIDIYDCNISELSVARICIKSKTCFPLHNPRKPCFSSLTEVHISSCNCLKELTLLMFAPNLRSLCVVDLDQLEDIINKDKACQGEVSGIVPFSKMVSLMLGGLPKLKNIYWRPLPFPCLNKIDVFKCPKLKKLPLDSKSGKHGENGLSIINYAQKEWIEGLEWEDEATKTRFLVSSSRQPAGPRF